MEASRRLEENPFFVLGLSPLATLAEAERAAQRLLAELAVGRESARLYATPFGRVERTSERVRAAVAELRDPVRRLGHEVWAGVPLQDRLPTVVPAVPWSLAARALGLSR